MQKLGLTSSGRGASQRRGHPPSSMSLTVLIALLLLMTGCWRRSAELQDLQQILRISGMQLGGDLPGKSVLSNYWTPSHIEAVPDLKPKGTYVFVRRPPFEHAYFAEQVFPALLEAKGFTVVKKPTKEDGYTYLYMGGPVYTIEFKRDGHPYSLAARYTPQLSQQYGMVSEVLILWTPTM